MFIMGGKTSSAHSFPGTLPNAGASLTPVELRGMPRGFILHGGYDADAGAAGAPLLPGGVCILCICVCVCVKV